MFFSIIAICVYLYLYLYLKDLAGKTDWEQAKVDMVIDCIEDTLRPLFQLFYAESDEAKVNIQVEISQHVIIINFNNMLLKH